MTTHHTFSGGLRIVDDRLLVIQIPRGRGAAPRDINALQGVLNDAAGALIAFTDGTLPADATMARLTEGMEALAYHREDVRKHAQPELDLGANDGRQIHQ